MTVIWKQVVGAGYLYEVSDQGRGRLSPLREIPSPTQAQSGASASPATLKRNVSLGGNVRTKS